MKGLGLFRFFAKKEALHNAGNENLIFVSDMQIKMGTFVNIQCLAASKDLAEECIARAFLHIDRLEQVFSRHDGSSLLSVLNMQGSLCDYPAEFKTVLEHALNIENRTAGAYNPSVLAVLEYLEKNSLVNATDLRERFALIIKNPVDFADNKIRLKQSGSIVTLDAIAKGYIVDFVANFFEEKGIRNYLINAGGDIRVNGMKSFEKGNEKTWKIAIEDPYKQKNYPAVFSLMRGAVATSGNYEKNFGEKGSHIILPAIQERIGQKECFPQGTAEHVSPFVKSVSVIAPEAMQADAYATALSCMPVDAAVEYVNKHAQLACMIIAEDDSKHYSDNWKLR